MNPFESEQLWQDPANWVFGILYRSAADPRWVVPMRYTNAAWTPNLAHAQAVLISVAILAAAIAPAVTIGLLGKLSDPMTAIGAVLWFFVCFLPVGVLARYRSE